MGFFGSGSGKGVDPAAYAMPVSMPEVKTDTMLTEAERPKEAELADLTDYWRVERRRKERNGVRGTFTVGMGDGDE